jgi:hypothetical protein
MPGSLRDSGDFGESEFWRTGSTAFAHRTMGPARQIRLGPDPGHPDFIGYRNKIIKFRYSFRNTIICSKNRISIKINEFKMGRSIKHTTNAWVEFIDNMYRNIL